MTARKPHPVAQSAIDALARADSRAWSALFERGAKLYDDGAPRALAEFTRSAIGHERFTSVDRVEKDGLRVIGHFHSDQWGDFVTYFEIELAPSGKIKRLDIGQA